MDFFAEALQSDVCDIQQGTTAEGLHLGAMASTVDLMQRVATGIEVKDDLLRFNPWLPEEVGRLAFRIRYRDHSLDLLLTREELTLRARDPGAAPIKLAVRDRLCDLEGGATRTFALQ